MPNPMSTYRIEVVADSGEGRNRIMAYDKQGFAFGDTGERNNTVEDYQTTLKALYFAIERIAELEQAIAALQAQGAEPVSEQLKGLASSAYCRYIDQMKRNECLGCDHKLKRGEFERRNLEAFCLGYEYLGRHRAFSEAAALTRTAPPAQAARVPDVAQLLADAKEWRRRERALNPKQRVLASDLIGYMEDQLSVAPAPAEKYDPTATIDGLPEVGQVVEFSRLDSDFWGTGEVIGYHNKWIWMIYQGLPNSWAIDTIHFRSPAAPVTGEAG